MSIKTTAAKKPSTAKSTRTSRAKQSPLSPSELVEESVAVASPSVAKGGKAKSEKTKYSNSSEAGALAATRPAKKSRNTAPSMEEPDTADLDAEAYDGSDGDDQVDAAPDISAAFDSDIEVLLSAPAPGGKASGNGRKPIVPPEVIEPGMSLLMYLSKCTPPLDKKIIDIACSQSMVFGELRKDVAQEVSLVWSLYKPDTSKYKPGQIASYAHRIAGHTALRVRRDLGSAVRLPGSAFRSRSDGSSYVTPGVLAQALDWNDIENWMLLDGAEPGMNGISSISLEVEGVVKHLEESGEVSSEADAEEASRGARLQHLEANKDSLTERQYSILKSMIEGSRIDEIMEEHHIKKGLLLREIHIAMELMWHGK